MSSVFSKIGLLSLLSLAVLVGAANDGYAQGCLGPGQQRQAIANGQALPFGSIASRLRGELVGARLCRQGGRLIYVVTTLQGNRRVDAVFDAKSGRKLR